MMLTGGEITRPAGRVAVDLGDTVRFVIMADVVEELHVHGYDEFVDLAAGETATLEFVANIPGIFEVEFERSRREALELVVS